MTECVFCTLPSEKDDAKNLILQRTPHCFAILNKYPYNSGHLMIIPFQHTADLGSLPEEVLLDLQKMIRDWTEKLRTQMHAQGFNIGMNVGEAGGAGIREHLHYHIVPRWNGDTNYMPVLGDVKVLPESLRETFKRLHG